jgi:hypothetical protein
LKTGTAAGACARGADENSTEAKRHNSIASRMV